MLKYLLASIFSSLLMSALVIVLVNQHSKISKLQQKISDTQKNIEKNNTEIFKIK